jgi:alpha-tubulin suppressor-like RCC1 family protein
MALRNIAVYWRKAQSIGPVAALGLAVFISACHDSPVAPHAAPPRAAYVVSAIACTYARGDSALPCAQYASAKARTRAQALAVVRAVPVPTTAPTLVAVRRSSGRGGVVVRSVYLGEQGVQVFFATDSVKLSGGVFSFQGTVQNLLSEPLGTADGLTPAPDSIIVFFSQTPVATQGSGNIRVQAPDTGTFTATNQPYYQYLGLLPSNGTTAPLLWNFNVDAGVQKFAFNLYVAGQVPDTSSGALAIPPHVFDSLAVGEAHNCAIRAGNHEYCWGFNEYGGLGILASGPAATPRGVLGNLAMQYLTAGSEFSCGVASTGAFCWGDNLSGEIADGTFVDRGEPVSITAPSGQYAAIAAGTEFACGLAGTSASCWGDNLYGELGDGTNTSHATPKPITGGLQLTAIVAGAFHACGLTSAGAAYCWGDNADGELGNGGNTNSATPVAVSGGHAFQALAAGAGFTCGVDTSHHAYCWGANTYGALGSGSAGGAVNTPSPVTGGVTFTQITAGAYHACALTVSGAAYCWGGNNSGQVGDGSTNDRSGPVTVSGAYAFTAIGAGFAHTCALTQTGGTYCWGDNSSGQIGDGTFSQRLTPTAVLMP